MKTSFRLVNSHSTCQQCLYSFEIDTYGRGCLHNCVYCYAKAELTVHGMWNNPVPAPIDINSVREAFYLAFETDRTNKWVDLLRRRIPLRIGSMSDSFMGLDKKYGVTKELLRILKFYKYPSVIFTRSDLVADDEYLDLLDRKNTAVQFSISSINPELSEAIEPGAPAPARRLKALAKLAEAGIWTTVRINPLFPNHPDGYFTDPDFSWPGDVPKFEFSTFDMVDEIAMHNVPAIIVGFGRFSAFALNNIKKVAGVDLRPFFRRNDVMKSNRDFHYSDKEVRYYYEQYRKQAVKNCMEFTTCYIGNGDDHFWKDQDIWSNKVDCCNVKNQVPGFQRDCREIAFGDRLRFTNKKTATPTTDKLHLPLCLPNADAPETSV